MAIVYYPNDQLLYSKDTAQGNYQSLVLASSPNVVLYFGTASTVSSASAMDLTITCSWARTASVVLNGGGASITTGSTYQITSSWATASVSASYAVSASYVDTSLQGWWKFGDGSGSGVTDSSIFKRHGLILGSGYSWITNSYVGSNSSALSLTTNSWISLGTKIHMLGDMSLCLWINKISTDGNFPGFLGAYIQNSSGILIFLDPTSAGGVLQVADANSNISFAGTNIGITGSWHHLVATVDRKQNLISMYMDGVRQALSASIAAVGFNESTTYWVINSRYDTNYNNHGTMYVDDARVYSRVLSQAEISALFAAGPA